MQTLETIQALVADITFNDWDYLVKLDGDRPYLQIKFQAPCNMTGETYSQSGRKWMLSYHMTDDEIVSTALKATLTAVEHEAREQFKWRDQPIYRPHYNIYELHKLSSRGATMKRDDSDSSWVGQVDRQGGSFDDLEIIDSMTQDLMDKMGR